MADKYAVVGQGACASATATVTSSPVRLVPGDNAIVVTTSADNQTFTVTMCEGTSAVVTSGTATITGDPKACGAGAATTVTVSNTVTNGTCTITVTYASTGLYNSAYSWAATSGGTPNVTVPSTDDNALFDSNSFTAAGQTFTINVTNQKCANMDWTGVTNNPTLAGTSAFSIYGSLTLLGTASMTVTCSSNLSFLSTSVGKTITFGQASSSALFINGVGGEWTLQDAYNSSAVNKNVSITNGNLITNSQTMSLGTGTFSISGANTRGLDMSGSTINCGIWTATDITNLTFVTDATSKIVMANSSTFAGGGLTNYPEVDLTSAGGSTITISGSNTFASLVLNSLATQDVKFTDGTNQTVTDATLDGSAGHIHTLRGTSTGGWTITKAGGGTVTVDYAAISYSTGAPAATWIPGSNTTNGGHNTGWAFKSARTNFPRLIASGIIR